MAKKNANVMPIPKAWREKEYVGGAHLPLMNKTFHSYYLLLLYCTVAAEDIEPSRDLE